MFDELTVDGAWTTGAWTGGQIGDDPVLSQLGTLRGSRWHVHHQRVRRHRADRCEVRSSTIERSLVGTFAGLIAVIVVAVMFMTAEYRRGLIRTTFAASPRRGRVLAAKAVVIGTVTFVVGLVAAFLAVKVGQHMMRSNGVPADPVGTLTEMRIVVGTAVLLAVAAVLALAVATVLRRSAGAVATVIVAIVLPYILATASILPTGPSEWLLRLTPAAAFSIQQSLVEYPQVSGLLRTGERLLSAGPRGPGSRVLCGYTAVALAAATTLLRRRDA